jgi:drug/metabolite transporter (DMT)-like permease
MNDALSLLAIIALLVLPPTLVHWLRRTRWFWLPGAGLIVLGIVAFASMPDTHSDIGGMNALASAMLAISGICLLIYGAVCLAIAYRLHARAVPRPYIPPPPAVELPRAIVVDKVSKT